MSTKDLFLIALTAACVAGCSWRSPAVEFYTLTPLTESEAEAVPEGLAVAVGPAAFPDILQRAPIATRSGENRVVYDEFHRWGGSLEADFLRVLSENLALLLRTDHVVVYPLEASYPIAYRVALDVQQFDGRLGDAVTLRARWTLTAGSGGPALAVDSSSIRVPLASSDHGDLVAAHSAALALLSREIAAEIAVLAGSTPP